MKDRQSVFFAVSLVLGLILSGCGLLTDSDSVSNNNSYGKITVTPSTVTLARGDTQQFTADQSWVTWSLAEAAGNSSIDSSGLLTIGTDETASAITVKASKSNYDTGSARVNVASPSATPQGLKASKPGPNSIDLSWQAISGAGEYTVYRSTNGTNFGQVGKASGTSYMDNAVGAGSSYYYRISANGVNSSIIFAFAADYFNMPLFSQRKLIPLDASRKHYYRFAVNTGQSYTLEWQNGDGQNVNSSIRVSAWQNNGTSIFTDVRYDGYTNPKVFTATASGHITVEVNNTSSSTSIDYQIYCYGSDGAVDTGTVALPPYKVSVFRVSAPNSSSITLTWDTVSDAVKYNIYRSNTQTGTPGKMGESSVASYTDSQVPSGGSFWYTIAAVNADGREGCRLQGAFAFAASHYTLSYYSGSQLLSLAAGSKHYYRMAVISGQQYTIQWQDGSTPPQNVNSSIRVSAWQNNGTSIFADIRYDGYTNPKIFTANASGYVTVEVNNASSSTSYNYQIYYF
jgi:hypothetical protein